MSRQSAALARIRLAAVLVVLLFVAGGCSHLSVRHLNRKPWVVNQPQTLETKFWRFTFESVPMPDRYGVRGVAYPRVDKLPEWARWAEELWFEAYLSDDRGKVIAKDIHVSLPRALDPERGVAVEFVLEPEDLGGSGPLYVTFGYRMVLTEGKDVEKPRRHFAIERALTLF